MILKTQQPNCVLGRNIQKLREGTFKRCILFMRNLYDLIDQLPFRPETGSSDSSMRSFHSLLSSQDSVSGDSSNMKYKGQRQKSKSQWNLVSRNAKGQKLPPIEHTDERSTPRSHRQ